MSRPRLLPCLTTCLLGLASAFACGGTTSRVSTAAWAICSHNSECKIKPNSCCDTCGKPRLDDVDAVNDQHSDEHFHAVCPKPVPCPKCGTANNPNLVATCTESTCKALDVTQRSVSSCASDDDCKLRVTACCECGGSTARNDLIAIASAAESDYAALVCDEGQACPECAPIYPSDVEAYCSAGHCALRDAI